MGGLIRHAASAVVAVSMLIACGGGGSPAPAPAPQAQTPAPPPVFRAFVDMTAASNIDYEHGYRIQPPPDQPLRFSTSGVASGDYDRDGDIDLFVVRGDIGPNLLYRNNGSGVFTEVASAAGLAYTANANENYRHTGPAFADIDGDGDLDLFVGSVFGDPVFVYRNNGDGSFTDTTAGSGLDTLQAEFNLSAAFGDYDLDGDVDLFITHWGTNRNMQNPGDTEHLWRNDSTGSVISFTSVSESAGISPSILTLPDSLAQVRDRDHTFTASFARINDDLYPDLVVAADYNESMVFMNNGDGTFANVTDVLVITDSNGMGSAVGDYDNDGDLDWFVTSIYEQPENSNPVLTRNGNRLYRNDNGVFSDVTVPAGVVDGGWGWGACFLDLENDGQLDIYHTNGWGGAFYLDQSRAFVSGGNGSFSNQAANLGLDDTDEGRGVVCADFDGDGDIDIFQQHRGSPVSATLWRNVGANSRNHLQVRLVGNGSNTEAAGARIFTTTGTRVQMREIILGNNFLSQNPAVQTIGLNSYPQVDELRVEWPDGQSTTMTGIAAGQSLTLNQPP